MAVILASDADVTAQSRPSLPEIRLMTLDPGHFHAALVQKTMYPGVSPRVHVFAPLGPDLIAHLDSHLGATTRGRTTRPTWQLEVHASPDYFERMLADAPRQRRRHLGPEPRQDRRASCSRCAPA